MQRGRVSLVACTMQAKLPHGCHAVPLQGIVADGHHETCNNVFSWPQDQINPASSRATATTAFCELLPA